MPHPDDQNLLNYIRVLLRWKRFIFWLVGTTLVGSIGVSLVMTKWYQAEALLLVPEQPFGFGISPNLPGMDEISLPGLSMSRVTRETRRILAILGSRTMMETVIAQFGLQKQYDRKFRQDTIKDLRENTAFDVEDEGTISVMALDPSPAQAADMVNFMVAELVRRNTELNTAEARLTREFIEVQYDNNKQSLLQLEEDYKDFGLQHHVVALQEQTEAAIIAVAALQAEIVKQEIQVKVQSGMLGDNHPEVRRNRALLLEQQTRLEKMIFQGEQVERDVDKGESTRLFVPFHQVPEIGLQLMRLERDLKIQNEIHGLLTQFYEQAKIQEAKDTPAIQVLDPATPPERKYSPRRSLLVLAFTFASMIVAVGVVFGVEYLRRLKDAL